MPMRSISHADVRITQFRRDMGRGEQDILRPSSNAGGGPVSKKENLFIDVLVRGEVIAESNKQAVGILEQWRFGFRSLTLLGVFRSGSIDGGLYGGGARIDLIGQVLQSGIEFDQFADEPLANAF